MPQILDSIVESEDQVLQSWGGAASWEKQVGVWRESDCYVRLIGVLCQGNLRMFCVMRCIVVVL